MTETMDKFEGWAGLDEHACERQMKYQSFQPKPFEEDDVDIKILYCGICGSDVSALSGEWGSVEGKTQVCGHEIVGEVVRVGAKVENGIKIGSIVGIGAQSDSCRECVSCKDKEENFCQKTTFTFGAPYHRGESGKSGAISKGGFAKHWRGPSRFAIPVPEGIELAAAAPLFCGGVTVFSPLVEHGAGTTAKNVGVIGIGGLGHFAVLFASKMGAKVTAISRGTNKADDARALGATEVIATGESIAEGIKGHERSLDLIICTINPDELPVAEYLPLLRPHGTFVIVGIVPKPLSIPVFSLLGVNGKVAGSAIGSPDIIKRMLDFVKENDIKPWIQKYDMEDINKALPDFRAGKPRYRFVLVNKANGGVM